jgi:hypothetical protein
MNNNLGRLLRVAVPLGLGMLVFPARAADVSCLDHQQLLGNIGLPQSGQCYSGSLSTLRRQNPSEDGRFDNWTIGHLVVTEASHVVGGVGVPWEGFRGVFSAASLYPSVGDDPRPYVAADSYLGDGINFYDIPPGVYDVRVAGVLNRNFYLNRYRAPYLGVLVVSPVPEPASWAAMSMGLAMLGALAWRRHRT